MRKALQRRHRKGQARADIMTIAAPVAGWNARDPITAMKPNEARILENWLVGAGRIRVRPPTTTWATGLGGPVETLMPWNPPSGVARMFGAVQTNIFDVTVQGAVGASVQTSLSNGRWDHVNFSTPGGNYLWCCNGTDAPRHFNGTAWNQPVITAAAGTGTLNANNLTGVMSHMNRLFLLEKGTKRVRYLDIQSIAGTANLLDLSSFGHLGGEIVAQDSWTRDGGEGTDDLYVAITSTGEVFTFAGISPASDSTWSLAGIYRIPEPIGRRCTLKVGAELIILTKQGPLPLSRVMGLSVGSAKNKSITDKIAGAFTAAATRGAGFFGWQLFEYPGGNMILVNVPIQERTKQAQFVFGTTTGAWSSFADLNAGCWGLAAGVPYMGCNEGTVRRFDYGDGDNGQPILATYLHAYVDPGHGEEKIFKLAKPRVTGPPEYIPAVHVQTDYDESAISFSTLAAPSAGAAWDDAIWDQAEWSGDTAATQGWQDAEGVGGAVSVGYRIAARSQIEHNGMLLVYEKGGYL